MFGDHGEFVLRNTMILIGFTCKPKRVAFHTQSLGTTADDHDKVPEDHRQTFQQPKD
ncbi:Hypothetical protein FKW44_010861 [Caligus rogercresseyi]|uniref:Uncharacterized protein n=1 Tax=Caligus rogercresseyi TaxID=217165 RepID=A0A7T8HHR2_CALRO|nr:Hypothetical protein FKW44_010861 [Caligus rogercresseyi]